MGKLIKNHWARLIILVASSYQCLAALQAFFWPKLFFDFLTTNLDLAVRPVPILQIINLLLGILGLCWEWPLPIIIRASTSCGLSYVTKPIKTITNDPDTKTTSPISNTTKTTITTTSTKNTTKAALAASASATVNPSLSPPTKFQFLLASLHRSIEARLIIYPLSSLAALLLYQATNAGLYYIIGMGVYFWAFSEGEIVMGEPWTLPRRGGKRALVGPGATGAILV